MGTEIPAFRKQQCVWQEFTLEMFKKGGVKQFLNTAAVKESSSDGRQDFCFLYFLFVARFYLNVFVISASSPKLVFYCLNSELTGLVFFFYYIFQEEMNFCNLHCPD